MHSIAFAAALAVATNAANVFRSCQKPTMQQDFDVSKYLGTWYEQRRDKDCAYEDGVCNTANYQLTDNPKKLRVRNNEYHEDESEWEGGTGTATIVDPDAHEGYLKVKFVPLVPAGDYKILETDYDNYTVIYTCTGVPHTFNVEYAWILTRDQNPSDEIMSKALSVLAEKVPKYDFDTAFYETPQMLSDGSACPGNAPTSTQEKFWGVKQAIEFFTQ